MPWSVNLTDVAGEIRDGDLLLFRGRGLVALCIGVAGRSEYTHAARAVWWGNDLFCCEVRELRGGRAVTLESQVRKFPGAIDVFEVNPSARWREYCTMRTRRSARMSTERSISRRAAVRSAQPLPHHL